MAITNQIIGTIGAMQTLIENFPMSIFALLGNKVYTNPIDFVIDVLRQLGITNRVLVDKLIELFFNVPNAIELYGEASKYTYKLINKPTDEQIMLAVAYESVPDDDEIDSTYANYICVNDSYYVKKAPVPTELQSEFITGLENSVKGIIQNILTGLLSCSVIPEIPDRIIDKDVYNPNPLLRTDGILLPKNTFDMLNMLDINPLSDIGRNYYSGVDDGFLNVNDLYKANDLNAFLWYVINRGNIVTQKETNKMMWDSRIISEREGNDQQKRTSETDWNDWIESRSNIDDIFWLKNKSVYTAATDNPENTTVDIPLHPILQLQEYNDGLKISFPAQTWETKKFFNKSIYRFNEDYLKNIQIFNPRIIITEMINSLLNGSLLHALNPTYSIETTIFEAKLDEIIKQALEVEDLTVDDCFFSFSNDEFNAALKNMELQKYNAKELNSETSPAIQINENMGIDALNEINSMATMNEKINSISRTVYDIAAIPTQDTAIEISDKFSLGYNEEWLNDVIMALVRPLAKAIFTPKVMLLYLINFHIMGLIDINDVQSLNDVKNLIVKKMIAIIISMVKYVKDRILYFLQKLFEEEVKPLLIKCGAYVLREKLEDWLLLLEEAIAYLPLFDFNRYSIQTDLDDVNYADITQTQDEPESEKTC